jgi:hypothetical protein
MLATLADLASIATTIGVFFAGWQVSQSRKHHVTNFEDDLAREYRVLLKGIPVGLLLGDVPTEDEYRDCLDDMFRYIDLCNEQAFLHQKGRVRGETWIFWKDGIASNLKRPAFKRAWSEISRRAEGEFSELRKWFPPEP